MVVPIDLEIDQKRLQRRSVNIKKMHKMPSPRPNREGYQQLRQKIANSVMAVKKIKNGQHAELPGGALNPNRKLPFLVNPDISCDIKRYLTSGNVQLP